MIKFVKYCLWIIVIVINIYDDHMYITINIVYNARIDT